LEAYLDAYLDAAAIRDSGKSPLFRSAVWHSGTRGLCSNGTDMRCSTYLLHCYTNPYNEPDGFSPRFRQPLPHLPLSFFPLLWYIEAHMRCASTGTLV
jgi:hypothetical protein